MKEYEITFIVDEKDDEKAVVDLISELKGICKKTSDLGVREFAYDIEKRTNGKYYAVEFQMEPESIETFEKKIRQQKGIVRYLLAMALRPDKKMVKPAKTEDEQEEPISESIEKKEEVIVDQKEEIKEVKPEPKKEIKKEKPAELKKEKTAEMTSEELDKKLEELVKD